MKRPSRIGLACYLLRPLALGASEAEQAGTEEVALQACSNDCNPESRAFMVDELIPQSQADNPGVTLEMQFIGWGNHSEKYLTAWAGGEVPDIFEPALEQAAEMIAKGQTIALDKYVSAWGEIDDFFAVGCEPYLPDGSYYTIPFRLDILAADSRIPYQTLINLYLRSAPPAASGSCSGSEAAFERLGERSI